MAEENDMNTAIEKIKNYEKKRNFDQSVDLIVNLRNFDVRREAFNIIVQVPNKIKDQKIVGFFEKDNKLVDVIKKLDFQKYKDKKEIKKLLKTYDSFISNAKLMPAVATGFGRVLGPAGKMPSPKLGIVVSEDEAQVKNVINKINLSVRIRVKEPSIKVCIGKESLENNKIKENAKKVLKEIIAALPKGKENIRDIKIKLTMGKPEKIKDA